MAGYRPAGMVRTPWGNADELRSRRLPAGRGTPREEAARNQRERLFAALVATVATKGYEATRVADLEHLAGVSRSAFYKHFRDKEGCFLAAVEALIGTTIAAISHTDGRPPSEEERARGAFRSFVDLIVAQPAAARMCFVDIYAAGPRAVGVVEKATDAFEGFVGGMLEGMPGRAGMPPALVRAMVGGLRKVIHKRLYRGEEAELAALAEPMFEWGLGYEAPPAPLRARRRRAAVAAAAERDGSVGDPVERLLRAVAAAGAEKGYPNVTVAEIVERAATSQRTFYENFENKEEALLAALDAGSAQMLAATLPAFRRAPDWPAAVRGALEALLAYGASEPEYTRLGAVEVYAAGPRALEQRDMVMEGLEALLVPGYELAPGVPAVAAEAIGGAIYTLIYDQVRSHGPASLPQIAPVATYVALAPFLGAEGACAVANGEGR
jgi:AcrR family transcriptional regulator